MTPTSQTPPVAPRERESEPLTDGADPVIDPRPVEPPAEPAADELRAQPEAHASTQVVLGVVGAVCATIITSALDTSPEARLLSAALGSAIPQLVTLAGPWHHIRVGLCVAAAAVALFITYGGVTLFDSATGEETFPVPEVLTTGPTVEPPPADRRGSAELKIAVFGSGEVDIAPHGVTCPGTCGVDVPIGESVVLTASSGSDSEFEGFSPPCGDSPCTVRVDEAQLITATFVSPTQPPAPPGTEGQ